MKLIILIAGIVLLLIAAALGFGWFDDNGGDYGGWLALGLAVSFASFLPIDR